MTQGGILSGKVPDDTLLVLAKIGVWLRVATALLIVVACSVGGSYPAAELWFAVGCLLLSFFGVFSGWRDGFVSVAALPLVVMDVAAAAAMAVAAEMHGLSTVYLCYVLVLHGFAGKRGFLAVVWISAVASGLAMLLVRVISGVVPTFTEVVEVIGLLGMAIATAYIGYFAAQLLSRSRIFWSKLVMLATDQGRQEARAQVMRDMHDMVVKDLHGSMMLAEVLTADLDGRDDPSAERAREVVTGIATALRSSRALVSELREESQSSGSDLEGRIKVIAARYPEFHTLVDVSSNALVEVGGDGDGIVRAVTELLENVHRHAKATRAEVTVGVDGVRVVAAVRDDGIGIGDVDWQQLEASKHFGLLGLKETMEARGGGIVAESAGVGTVVEFWFPLRRKWSV
ncbi:MAG: histidine kinase [Propionibacteriaceae bacterium]|nr:histidine kinase [Propionibacteriaceae bacterium]